MFYDIKGLETAFFYCIDKAPDNMLECFMIIKK
jgi:hypothetical protein